MTMTSHSGHSPWTFYIFVVIKIIGTMAEELCEQCDCYISEGSENRAIRNIKPPCNEGMIQWTSPKGALRIELHPGYSSDFRACFVLDAANIAIKVSQEHWKRTKIPLRKRINPSSELRAIVAATNRTREFCIHSESNPVLLFLEPERFVQWQGLERVKFHYLIESRTRRLTYSPMEDCRPCDDRELIRAYCSSDFVVTGTMDNVRHMDAIDKTRVDVVVTRLIRHKNEMFKYNDRQRLIRGQVMVPRKCNVQRGSGDFLFTGRLRLGHMVITCVPYLEDWERVLKNALADGTMQCSID